MGISSCNFNLPLKFLHDYVLHEDSFIRSHFIVLIPNLVIKPLCKWIIGHENILTFLTWVIPSLLGKYTIQPLNWFVLIFFNENDNFQTGSCPFTQNCGPHTKKLSVGQLGPGLGILQTNSHIIRSSPGIPQPIWSYTRHPYFYGVFLWHHPNWILFQIQIILSFGHCGSLS